MINKELLTNFIHEELSYVDDIICDNFNVFNTAIDIKVRNKSGSIQGFGEVVKIERYNKWLSEKRDNKISQLWKNTN